MYHTSKSIGHPERLIFEGPRCFCLHSVMCAHLPGLFCTSSMWDATLHQIFYTAGTICLFTNTVNVSFPPLFHAVSLSNSPYIRISKAPVRTPVSQTLQELSVKANLLLVLYGTCGIGIFHKKINLDPYLLKEQFVPDDLHSSKVKKEDSFSTIFFFNEPFLS